MTHEQFISKSKTWINHKLILSRCSYWYKNKCSQAQIEHIRKIFGAFISGRIRYSAGQLAILIRRHSELLEAVLPIPNNPSYENSLNMLNSLIQEADKIIHQFNLSAHV